MRKIYVLEAGFVLIGIEAGKDENGFIIVTEASIIRRWGTTKGLGEIALNGIQPETILDNEGVTHVNPDKIIRVILCTW